MAQVTGYPILKGLYVGKPAIQRDYEGKEFYSGILKLPVEEAMLRMGGFDGDGVADTIHHGGLDRAVCLYSTERYEQWNEEFGVKLIPGSFGENLLVEDMHEENVHIGDVFQVGETVIQVTQGRAPCKTIDQRTGIPTLMKRIFETRHTGFLCRVIEEGVIREDSVIRKLQEDANRISVLEANDIFLHKTKSMDGMEKLLSVQPLAEKWRQKLEQRLLKLQKS